MAAKTNYAITRSNTEILSGKVVKEQVTVEFSTIMNDVASNGSYSWQTKQRMPHPDLKQALQNLSGYLAITHHYEKDFDKVMATGVKVVKNGVFIITGKLLTPSEASVGITSGKLSCGDDSFYDFADNLVKDIDYFFDELFAYTFEGKESQLKIDFPDEEGGEKEDGEIF